MRTTLPLLLLAAALLAAPRPAAAVDADTTIALAFERGHFIVFDHDRPVASERYVCDRVADSLQITAVAERRMRGADGTEKTYRKTAGLVLGAREHELRRYTVNVLFEGRTSVRGVIPGDTTMTVYSEDEKGGVSDRIPQPPGRFTILDPMVFTWFDQMFRTLNGRVIGSRTVSILTLGQQASTSEATVSVDGTDRITWGGKPLVTTRWTMRDDNVRFTVWTDPDGHMLRLEQPESGLLVMREEPAPPRRRTPTPKRR